MQSRGNLSQPVVEAESKIPLTNDLQPNPRNDDRLIERFLQASNPSLVYQGTEHEK
jgi:hypothetical protein